MAVAEPLRPNFVVVVSDDHTFRAVGYRNPQVHTPHLNELAAGGFRFDRFFVASPICVASRASLYSGVYPQQHDEQGIRMVEATVTHIQLASLLEFRYGPGPVTEKPK